MSRHRPPRRLISAVAGALAITACGSTVQTHSQVGIADQQGSGLAATSETAAATHQEQQSRTPTSPGSNAGSGGSTLAGATGTAARPGLAQAPQSGSQVATTQASIPRTGPGWDAKSIYIGIPTQEDFGAAAAALGFTFQPGSVNGDFKAIIADVNAHGGVLGRQIVPLFHDNSTTSIQSNAESVAQANCSYFTQDHKVIAVLNTTTPIDTDSFRRCLKKANTPLIALEYQLYDNETFQQGGPHLLTAVTYNLSTFGASWASTLKSIGYFSGWDTTQGAASAKPAVAGLLQTDTPLGHRLTGVISARLKSLGINIGATYYYPDTGTPDMSNAVLQFKTKGVTHVLTIPPAASATLSFATAANQQGYRPRYALSSYLLPTTLASVFSTAGVSRQLEGAMGVGWTPKSDVNDAQDAPDNALQKKCRAALARGGQTFSGDSQRFAYFVGLETCDAVHLLADGFTWAQGLGADAFTRGLVGLGPSYPVAATFSNGLTPTSHAVPGQVRNLIYQSACSCFAYQGAPHALTP